MSQTPVSLPLIGWARTKFGVTGSTIDFIPQVCISVKKGIEKMPKALDVKGLRFGRLVAVCRAKVPGARNAMWECQCDCGGMTIAAAANLGRSSRSCGCLLSESATASLRINRLLIKGLHGKSRTPEWNIWFTMKQRCYNPKATKYPRYGGRGIKVCDRWLESFPNFLED